MSRPPLEVADIIRAAGEAFIERGGVFQTQGTNPDAMATASSSYKILANRVITE